MRLNTVIDDRLFAQARQLTGLRKEQDVLEAVLRAWIGLQREEGAVDALRRQKAAYSGRIPLAAVEPPNAPSLYAGKPLSIEEMRTAARAAAARRG